MTTKVRVDGTLDPNALSSMGKCVYCGRSRASDLVKALRISKDKKIGLAIPYCAEHLRDAKRNRVVLGASTWIGGVLGMAIAIGIAFLTSPLFLKVDESSLVDFFSRLACLAVFLAAWGLSRQLMIKFISLFNVSLRDSLRDTPRDYLGFRAESDNGVLAFSFVNDRIAAEFVEGKPERRVAEGPARQDSKVL